MSLWGEIKSDYRWYGRIEGGSRWAPMHPGFWVTVNYRYGHWARGVRAPVVGKCCRILYRLTNLVVSTVTSCDVEAGAEIGAQFTVHTSRGVFIANGVRIGDHCIVNNDVCIVNRMDDRASGPAHIGDRVRFGMGSKVLGAVRIGDDVMVGANAVVLCDVPADSLVVGVPGVVKRRGPAKVHIDSRETAGD